MNHYDLFKIVFKKHYRRGEATRMEEIKWSFQRSMSLIQKATSNSRTRLNFYLIWALTFSQFFPLLELALSRSNKLKCPLNIGTYCAIDHPSTRRNTYQRIFDK